MSRVNLPLDSAALDRLENKDLDRVRESAYQDLIEQGRVALVLRDELASRSRASAHHTTQHDDCGGQYAALNALLVKQRADFAKQVDAFEARVSTLEAELEHVRITAQGLLHEWQAHANALRDALLRIQIGCGCGCDDFAAKALAQTPAASLAALKAEVLEPYKAALRVFIDNGDLDTYEESFAAEVRALAAQEVTK